MWSFVLFCSAWYCDVGCEEGGGAWCGVLCVCIICLDKLELHGGMKDLPGRGGGRLNFVFEFGRVREIRGLFHSKYFLNCAIWDDLQYILIKF